ncbi:Uncharacterised protein [uncultured archaeon]|nr:Uncharacterised protein [uncultured archaeon]
MALLKHAEVGATEKTGDAGVKSTAVTSANAGATKELPAL